MLSDLAAGGHTLQGMVSLPNTLQILYKHFTRDGQCAKCANNQTPDRMLMPRCREREALIGSSFYQKAETSQQVDRG